MNIIHVHTATEHEKTRGLIFVGSAGGFAFRITPPIPSRSFTSQRRIGKQNTSHRPKEIQMGVNARRSPAYICIMYLVYVYDEQRVLG